MKKSLFILLLFLAANVNSANLYLAENEKNLTIYYSELDKIGEKAIMKGQVLSISNNPDLENLAIARYSGGKNMTTVRLYNATNLLKGDELLVINERNLVKARVIIYTVFESQSLGYLLTGHGNLRLVNEGDRVVQKVTSFCTEPSFATKAQGDYYLRNGNIDEAINYYNKVIAEDPNNAEAHIELGYIYLNKNLLLYADKEFRAGYKNLPRIFDRDDQYRLLSGLVTTTYKQVYELNMAQPNRDKLIAEGIKFSSETIKLNKESKEMYLILGNFYLKSAGGNDNQKTEIKARDAFVKVITLDPENIEALTALCEIYRKHNNQKKIDQYANQLLLADPTSQYARKLLNK